MSACRQVDSVPSRPPKRSRSWLEESSSALEADRLQAELRKAAKVVDLDPVQVPSKPSIDLGGVY